MKQSWSTTTSTTACRFCEEEFSNTQTHLSFFCKWTYISGPFYRHCFNTWMHRLSCVLLQTEPYNDMKHQNLELVAPLVTCFTHWTLCQWTLMQHWTVKNVKCKPAISNTAVDEFVFFFCYLSFTWKNTLKWKNYDRRTRTRTRTRTRFPGEENASVKTPTEPPGVFLFLKTKLCVISFLLEDLDIQNVQIFFLKKVKPFSHCCKLSSGTRHSNTPLWCLHLNDYLLPIYLFIYWTFF